MPIFAHKNCRTSFSWKSHLFSVFYFFVVLLDSIFEKPRGLVPQNTFWIFENCDKLNFILRTLKRSLAWLKCSHYVNFVRSNTLSPFSGKFFCLPHSTSNALEKYRYRNKQSEILDADKRKTEIKHQPISEWGGTRPAPDIKAVTTIPNDPAGTCWFIASSNQCKIGLGDSNYVRSSKFIKRWRLTTLIWSISLFSFELLPSCSGYIPEL